MPYIDMNPPWVHMNSQTWTPLPPPTPYHLSGSSPYTNPKHPVSCIKHRLAIRFLHDSIHVSKEKWLKRNEDNLRDLQDNMKRSNIQIIGVREEEDKKKDHEKILEEIIVENFPKMGKEIITQVQETQRVPNRINPRWNITRHILIKLTKIKHKKQILKAAREKQQITRKGTPNSWSFNRNSSGQKGMARRI